MKTTLKAKNPISKTLEVRVGWFGGKQRRKSVLTNAAVALYNQDERPFWEVWKEANEVAYKKALIILFKKYSFKENEILVNRMAQLGVKMRNDLQYLILNGSWLPNAPSTIARKQSSKPLIDTAQMLNSVRVVVSKDGKSNIIL